ncbi:MAG TPA: Fic/DOC family N-terminal domain-containing protein [Frankiaceae bacterium]|nr:Fic/DOC family N-terminal domain-containing protein [Frankiaceae bacterium]
MSSDPNWPRLTYEDRPRTPGIPPDLVSRRLRERYAGPYRAAVVPSIATAQPVLSSAVAALADDGTAEVARFDAEIGAELAPFASVLMRSESSSSSRIENLTSGAKSLALAELGSRERSNATEIVGNVAAMTAALRLA